jgi:hypothetical protein
MGLKIKDNGPWPFPDNPLDLRAWTMQGALLALRVWYFGKNALLWKCQSGDVDADLEKSETHIKGPRLPLSVFTGETSGLKLPNILARI